MAKKTRREFSDEQKRKAVDDYVPGRKSAEQVAAENGVDRGIIYKWRVQLDEKAKGMRIEELEEQGFSPSQARLIEQQQAEIELYKAKVAEQAIVIDLLKKLQTSIASRRESELTGLIDTVNARLAPKSLQNNGAFDVNLPLRSEDHAC